MERKGGERTAVPRIGRPRARGRDESWPVEGFDFSGTASVPAPPDGMDDLDRFARSLHRQLRQHPIRTLLVAAGLGYLIGRAFRRA